MEQQQKPQDNPDDLDSLLNSALEDFEELARAGHYNTTTSSSPSPSSSSSSSTTTTSSSRSGPTAHTGNSNSFDYTRFVQSFAKLSQPEDPNNVNRPPTDTNNRSDDDIVDALLKDFDGNTGYQGLLQGMMKQLLAKEVLYEPMKEMRDKYPIWLKENKHNMPRAEFDKYLRQYNHIEEILFTYDKEGDEGFEKVLKLMREMQECGHVPAEIVKQLAPDVEFDDEGQPKFPGMDVLGNMDMAQCSIL